MCFLDAHDFDVYSEIDRDYMDLINTIDLGEILQNITSEISL